MELRQVKAVLLHDGWHNAEGRTFRVVTLSLAEEGGRSFDVAAATWREQGATLCCPLTALVCLKLEGDSYGRLVEVRGAEVFSDRGAAREAVPA
jgi:hypothetical protein